MKVDITINNNDDNENIDNTSTFCDYRKPTDEDFDNMDFSAVLLTSNITEKVLPIQMAADLLKFGLINDLGNKFKALILADHTYEWEKHFAADIDKVDICYNWEDFVGKCNINYRQYNFIVIEQNLADLLFNDIIQCTQILKIFRYSETFGFFVYVNSDQFDIAMDFYGDIFSMLQCFHNNHLSPRIMKYFGQTNNLKEDEFVVYIPRHDSRITITDVTDKVQLQESFKKFPKKK